MDVYAQVPGVDYGRTIGMCGNNDGTRDNDVPGLGYNAWMSEGSMPSEWRISSGQSLFDWQPPANVPPRQSPGSAPGLFNTFGVLY